MELRLIRHATTVITMGKKKILVDPMFSRAGTLDPAAPAAKELRNPLVELPCPVAEVMDVDMGLISHTHRDHLDDTAISALPKDLPLFCQPADEDKMKQHGFTRVEAVDGTVHYSGIQMTRTDGQHGRGEMAVKMGPVSGYVLEASHEPTLYITGDTVWCPAVEAVLRTIRPDVIVAFAGGAEFSTGGPITMTSADILQVAKAAPHAQIVAVHMEAWNHCGLSRAELRQAAEDAGVTSRIHIPVDGETLHFHSNVD